jgi:cyclase
MNCICQDAVASLYGRNSLCDIISRISREVFIPLTVGGGLRSLEDILRRNSQPVPTKSPSIPPPFMIPN